MVIKQGKVFEIKCSSILDVYVAPNEKIFIYVKMERGDIENVLSQIKNRCKVLLKNEIKHLNEREEK